MALVTACCAKISEQLMFFFAFCWKQLARRSIASEIVESMHHRLHGAKQEHLADFWDELTYEEQEQLLKDIQLLNLEECDEYFRRGRASLGFRLEDYLEPMPQSKIMKIDRTPVDVVKAYRNEGLRQISHGHVGVLLMAGEQGTRLGFTNPIGMYDVGLLSHKTLFHLQAERIFRLQQLAFEKTGHRGIITWYIMVSEHTIKPTHDYFVAKQYFHLGPKNVQFFKQTSLPYFDDGGKILLNQKHRVALSPDGSGGIFRALKKHHVLDDMLRRGVLYLHAYSVDNILTKVADPVFIGYCIMENADCATKVVERTNPNEPIDMIAMIGGHVKVIEYNSISPETAAARKSDGGLIFGAANISNHYFTYAFLNRICSRYECQLRLHAERVLMPYVAGCGQRITPEEPNAIKIEKCVFDAFEYAHNFVAMEVRRDIEYSAVKNDDSMGVDCPSTARDDLFHLHKMYIEAAGGTVYGDDCEISPLLSYDGENLEKQVAGQSFISPVYIQGPRYDAD